MLSYRLMRVHALSGKFGLFEDHPGPSFDLLNLYAHLIAFSNGLEIQCFLCFRLNACLPLVRNEK